METPRTPGRTGFRVSFKFLHLAYSSLSYPYLYSAQGRRPSGIN